MMRSRATPSSIDVNFTGLRIKRFTGTTGATEGSNVDFLHGLPNIQKIIGWKATVSFDNVLVAENERNSPDLEFSVQLNTDTEFRLKVAATKSADILSKPFKVLVFHTD